MTLGKNNDQYTIPLYSADAEQLLSDTLDDMRSEVIQELGGHASSEAYQNQHEILSPESQIQLYGERLAEARKGNFGLAA